MGNALHTPGAPDVGAVGPADARLDDAGLIAVQGPDLLNTRTGVLHGPGSTALIVGTATTAPMTVQVIPHHWVTTRGAVDGVYRGAAEVTKTVNIAAAPGSGSRTDVVYVKQNDAQSTVTPDGTTEPIYGVYSLPASPPVGAEELGRVVVSVGATATNGAGVTISQTARQTVAHGARIPARNQADRDALTRFGGLEVYRIDTGAIELCPSVSGTDWLTVYDPAWAGAWTAYTPTWQADGAATQPTIGNGSLVGRFKKLGSSSGVFKVQLTIGSTTAFGSGTASNPYSFSLPPGWTNASMATPGHGRYQSATDGGPAGALVDAGGTRIGTVQAAQNNAVVANGLLTAAGNYLLLTATVELA